MPPLSRKAVLPLIKLALREDAAHQDITSCAVIPPNARIRARIIAKAPGILAGGPAAAWTFSTLDRSLRCALRAREGTSLTRGQTILTVEGRTCSIFAAERTALNFLGHLSGIATLTQEFVRRVAGTRAVILDTRKTLPGLRALEKHAVRAGGGRSHRADLAQAILIKTNHLRARKRARKGGMGNGEWGSVIQHAIEQAKRLRPRRPVHIEVTNMHEYRAALRTRPHVILLDNWPLKRIRQAVALQQSAFHIPHSTLLLEVSGGVTLANVRAIARTGVDRISIGRLTHSAPSLDVSLEVL